MTYLLTMTLNSSRMLYYIVCMLWTEYASLKPENLAGARDMDTAIFDVRILLSFILYMCIQINYAFLIDLFLCFLCMYVFISLINFITRSFVRCMCMCLLSDRRASAKRRRQ